MNRWHDDSGPQVPHASSETAENGHCVEPACPPSLYGPHVSQPRLPLHLSNFPCESTDICFRPLGQREGEGGEGGPPGGRPQISGLLCFGSLELGIQSHTFPVLCI